MNAVFDLIVRLAAGLVIWFTAGTLVGLLFGRVIRQRDRQRPPEITDDEADGQRLAEVRYIRSRTEPGYPIDEAERAEAMQRHPASRNRDDEERRNG